MPKCVARRHIGIARVSIGELALDKRLREDRWCATSPVTEYPPSPPSTPRKKYKKFSVLLSQLNAGGMVFRTEPPPDTRKIVKSSFVAALASSKIWDAVAFAFVGVLRHRRDCPRQHELDQ